MHKTKTMQFKTDRTSIFMAVFKSVAINALLTVGFGTHAFGSSDAVPLLRSAEVTAVESEGFAEAMQRQLISQSLDQAPEGATDKLGILLQHAQESWLSGSIDSARENFAKMIEQALREDWRAPERETIVYAMMRLAQVSKNDFERDGILRRALVFAPDARIDEDLFPPPLVQRFQDLKNAGGEASERPSKKGVIRIRLKSIFKSAEFVRINGKKYPLDSDLDLALWPGEYRVSVFSDFALPLVMIMSEDELLHFSYHPTLLASGTCREPKLNVASTSVKVDVLFAKGCVRTWELNHWLPRPLGERQNGSSETPKSDIEQLSSIPSNGTIPSEWLPHPEESPSWSGAPKETQLWEKKETWIWVGVTAVVAGAVYAIYQNQHPARTNIQPNSIEIN